MPAPIGSLTTRCTPGQGAYRHGGRQSRTRSAWRVLAWRMATIGMAVGGWASVALPVHADTICPRGSQPNAPSKYQLYEVTMVAPPLPKGSKANGYCGVCSDFGTGTYGLNTENLTQDAAGCAKVNHVTGSISNAKPGWDEVWVDWGKNQCAKPGDTVKMQYWGSANVDVGKAVVLTMWTSCDTTGLIDPNTKSDNVAVQVDHANGADAPLPPWSILMLGTLLLGLLGRAARARED